MRVLFLHFVRFNLVGLTATATYFLSGIALGRLAGISELEVHVCAFILSTLVSYFGHARFVFRRAGPVYALRFGMATGFLFAASTALTVYLSSFFNLGGDLIVLIITIVYPLASFSIHSAWTFRALGTRKQSLRVEE